MSSSRLVYSTDKTVSHPNNVIGDTSGMKKDMLVTIYRQLKGRKGSGVTILSGFHLSRTELKSLVKQLKQECGSGGTIKKDHIEIQGDKLDKIVQLLTKMSFSTKKVGT